MDNEKGIAIAKQIVESKIEGQNRVLKKYGLRLFDGNVGNIENRKRLLAIERGLDLRAEIRKKLMTD